MPLLRVVVAGVAACPVDPWISALAHQLPTEVLCQRWPVNDPRETDLVMLLTAADADASHFSDELALRATLAAQTSGYQVIAVQASWQQALHAIGRALRPLAPSLAQPLLRADIAPRWHGVCEGCSDPACEYRLFTGLTSLSQPVSELDSLQG